MQGMNRDLTLRPVTAEANDPEPRDVMQGMNRDLMLRPVTAR